MSKILITGTSKGIGYDAALCLARNGHEIVATMRNPNNSDLSEAASKESLNIDIQALDVDDIDSVKEVFDKVGAIDVLINNAGAAKGTYQGPPHLELFDVVMAETKES